jgi:dTDP-4-amino-4,6-dideoxygalactose transaminase
MKIQLYSSTIRRKEMDAVLSCLVEEKTGPGELNLRLVQSVKEYFGVSGVVALRSPALALKYALKTFQLEQDSKIMISALAPDWQYSAIVDLGYVPMVLDVSLSNGLVEVETIKQGILDGGKILLYHETSGMLPNMEDLLELGIPIIEDISQSSLASIGEKKAGTFGVFSILGLEERDLLTAGGGACLIAPLSRDWAALRNLVEKMPLTDKLPDINAALAFVQLKESAKNEEIRKGMYEMYMRSLMQGRHKSLVSAIENGNQAVFSFPVLLESGMKDVKQYAAKKEIEIAPAFENSVVAFRSEEGEAAEKCINAKSMFLRCVNFPLYPMLGNAQASKIAKILATLP